MIVEVNVNSSTLAFASSIIRNLNEVSFFIRRQNDIFKLTRTINYVYTDPSQYTISCFVDTIEDQIQAESNHINRSYSLSPKYNKLTTAELILLKLINS